MVGGGDELCVYFSLRREATERVSQGGLAWQCATSEGDMPKVDFRIRAYFSGVKVPRLQRWYFRLGLERMLGGRDL